MRFVYFLSSLLVFLQLSGTVLADEASLQKQLTELTRRVEVLEAEVRQLGGKDSWKDPVYWQQLKRDMLDRDVIKILGKPARIDEQIFTTWYYHQTSRLHSYIWFDEGKVLGWEMPLG